MAELRLLVLHHHLWPGGVTSVIREGLLALSRFGNYEKVQARLLVGSARGVEDFAEKLKSAAPDRLEVETEVFPLLTYQNENGASESEFHSHVESIVQVIETACRSFRPEAMWVHNPTLGKNPALTAALSLLAMKKEIQMLYHIHDFAECGRFANAAFLRQWIQEEEIPLYPISPLVKIITLTKSDRRRLIHAGYPKEGVFRLPNPVSLQSDPHSLSAEERETADLALQEWSESRGFHFQAGVKWLLAPIRTIRRKNVLELAALRDLLGEPWQLLITLGSNSEPERPYADFAIEALQRLQCPATIGFGRELNQPELDFGRLYAAADMIGTGSVLEGFGLAFAESVLYGRPMFGRDLPDVTEEMKGLARQNLYQSFLVPLDQSERDRILNEYRKKILETSLETGIEQEVRQEAFKSITKLFSEPLVDFSRLDASGQYRVLKSMKNPSMLKNIREANPEIEEILGKGFTPPSEADKEKIREELGPQCFAERFKNILKASSSAESESKAISKGLMQEFFRPPFLRLILTTGDDWRKWDERLLPRYVGKVAMEHKEDKSFQVQPMSRSSGLRVVMWDVYATLLLSTLGDLEQKLLKKSEPGPFFETLVAAGLDTSHPKADPVAVFREIIQSDHEAGKSRGLVQPEVSIENVWQRLTERVLPGQWLSTDQARYAAARHELKTNPVRLNEGAQECIREIHQLGFLQGILSNAQFYTPEILKYVLGEKTWALIHPALRFWSYKQGAAKPDPAMFSSAMVHLRQRGMAPEQVVLIGDSANNDIEPAKSWGWKAVQIKDSGEASPVADFTCSHLEEIISWLKEQD